MGFAQDLAIVKKKNSQKLSRIIQIMPLLSLLLLSFHQGLWESGLEDELLSIKSGLGEKR